ncbi:PssD/Cps14F family polysaccharide biosynthesis glycosyltransferase [Thermococcus barophilus]|uniref:UDP-N-acetylglucosamine:LPS N-acetylglucosamine transferase n=1 Tax=Thermococcus barophilus TaxID=55802 RepID=A0A0S1XF26_THEBA|nr:PssD/Cps14F family polysaccharide biosynthesis glycosyltransferase [Thermococcus barophilus]ALM76395.1 UDP-N-acetylglucosamine:LPS N-acetylglucosamine transferase [Thermococcus barophilus]
MKIAIICSHGGHLTEMLYLMDAFKNHDVFFVTYDHPRTRGLPYKKYLFPNFGEKPFKIITYLPKIVNVITKEKPDIMISNGAEIAVPFFYLGKILGIKTIFIECYTRIDEPTITGRLVYPLSDYFFVLWPEMLQPYGKKAKYVGGLFKKIKRNVNLDEKKNQIFVITGTHYLGFERLVKAIDMIAKDFTYRFIIQLGHTPYRPKNAEYFIFIKEDKEIKKLMRLSKVVITQGAMSLIDALMNGSTVIAFPRLSTFGEHINDHQLTFSKKLEKKGLVRVATDENSLKKILADLLTTPKVKWRESVVVNRRLINILREVISDE